MLSLPSPLPRDLTDIEKLLRDLIRSEMCWIAQSDAPHHQAFANVARWRAMLAQLAEIREQHTDSLLASMVDQPSLVSGGRERSAV